jgi:hypothetical protein
MPSLHELQSSFADALFAGETRVHAAIRGGALPPAERVAIYRNNVREGFAKALDAAFPVIHQLVGEEYFRQLARDYQAAHPSTRGNLHHAGRALPGFLRSRFRGTPHDYFADVAALEWAWQEVAVAADAAPWDASVLAAWPADALPGLRFRLHPAFALIRSPWPVHAIWLAHQPGGDPGAVNLAAGGEALAVHRVGERIRLTPVGDAEHAFLAELLHGRSFGEALDAALALDPSFPLDATLARWIGFGAIAGLHGDPR